jgi:hypothetical protein
LHKTLAEIDALPYDELMLWSAYYERKDRERQG